MSYSLKIDEDTMPIREIKLKSDKEQIFEHFSGGAQPPRSSFQGWLEPPSPHVVGAYGLHATMVESVKGMKSNRNDNLQTYKV